jgi:hypothetical protein
MSVSVNRSILQGWVKDIIAIWISSAIPYLLLRIVIPETGRNRESGRSQPIHTGFESRLSFDELKRQTLLLFPRLCFSRVSAFASPSLFAHANFC